MSTTRLAGISIHLQYLFSISKLVIMDNLILGNRFSDYVPDPCDRDEDVDFCEDCESPLDECVCHLHDRYDEERDRRHEI